MIAHTPRPGQGLTLERDRRSVSFSAPWRSKGWRHPWTVDASWWQPHGKKGQWIATVKAGFVNGKAPIYRTDLQLEAEAGRNYGVNPLSGEPYFSAWVFSRDKVQPALAGPVDIPIYFSPAIPLKAFRSLGEDGPEGSTVPEVFQSFGVQSFDPESPADPRTVRRLRAVDLILHQPRLALTSNITIEPGLLTGISLTRQVLSVRGPEADDVLRVYAGQFQPPSDVVDPLAEEYDEPAWDELLIATVYLLSPRGASPDSEPDGSWVAFVGHELFWNLMWAPAPILDAPDTHPDVPFIIPLAGGLAQPIVNSILAGGQDLAQNALNMIQGHSLAGTWWTPTGGGHDGSMPLEYTPQATAGQSRTEQQLAKARAAAVLKQAAQRAQQQLDPDFPYRAIGFDPQRL